MENQRIINSHMNKEIGTKWFTFFTKVRPWLICLASLSIIMDFVKYSDIYTRYWWWMLYFLAILTQTVLGILEFIKSKGDYDDFVDFVKGALLGEVVIMTYIFSVNLYATNPYDITVVIVIGVVIFLMGYFLWYRLNMKYFKKRIINAFKNR